MKLISKSKIQNLNGYLKIGIWKENVDTLPPRKAFIIKQLQVILIAIKDFNIDHCMLRASALTFYSLISIVPVFAMAFGIAKGFGIEQVLESQLRESLAGQEEAINKIVSFSHSLLENTQGGLIAGIGIVLLFWSVLKVLNNVEISFNAIWKVDKGRSWGRKITEYFSIMFIAPVIFAASSSVAVLVQTQVTHITESIQILGYAEPFIFFLLNLIPYVLQILLFTFIYWVIPNTKVRIQSAVVAGVLAGTAFQVVQWIYITFQVGVVKYNAIYGSFAALPLFLVWLNTSWIIALLGAEISHITQHYDHIMLSQRHKLDIDSFANKNLNALVIMHLLIKRFMTGKSAPTIHDIASELEISPYTTTAIIDDLMICGLVSKIHHLDLSAPAYQPAKDPSLISIASVLNEIAYLGVEDDVIAKQSNAFRDFANRIAAFEKLVESATENVLIKDID